MEPQRASWTQPDTTYGCIQEVFWGQGKPTGWAIGFPQLQNTSQTWWKWHLLPSRRPSEEAGATSRGPSVAPKQVLAVLWPWPPTDTIVVGSQGLNLESHYYNCFSTWHCLKLKNWYDRGEIIAQTPMQMPCNTDPTQRYLLHRAPRERHYISWLQVVICKCNWHASKTQSRNRSV